MPLELSALAPRDQQEVSTFLRETFGAPSDAPFLNPRVLSWKYFEPRPDWDRLRSYVLRNGTAIAAHGAVWPLRFQTPGGSVSSIHIIDWAASGASAGAGVALYREMMSWADTAIVIGGAESARKLLKRIGFSEKGQMGIHILPLRPMMQYRSWPERRGNLLRLIRNTAQSLPSPRTPARGCNVRPLAAGGAALAAALARAVPGDGIGAERTPAMLEYIERCPSPPVEGAVVYRDGQMIGYYLLAFAGGQCRLVDFRAFTDAAADWTDVCRAAVVRARQSRDCYEMTAAASTPEPAAALAAARFRFSHSKPIWLHDPKGLLSGGPPLNVGFLESDIFFIG